MTNNNIARNWIVVVEDHNNVVTYLGTFNIDADVSDGSRVKESDRCGVSRTENALRFTKRGAARIAKGYPRGRAVEIK